MHQKEKAVKPFTVIPYTEIVKDGFAVFLTLEFTIRYAEERKTGFFFCGVVCYNWNVQIISRMDTYEFQYLNPNMVRKFNTQSLDYNFRIISLY